jgi:hypothetical protein
MEVQGVKVNEMKINGKEAESNISLDDGRVGWKYPLRSKEISKACENFFKKCGMKQYDCAGNLKNELSKPFRYIK